MASAGLGVRFSASPFTRSSMGGEVNDFVAQQAVLAAEAEVMRYGFPGSAAVSGPGPGHSARGLTSGMGMLSTIEDEGQGEGDELGKVGVGTGEGGAGGAAAEDEDEVEKYLKLGSEHATSPGIRIPGRGSGEGFYAFGANGAGNVPTAGYTQPTLSTPFHPSSLPTHGFYGFPPSSGLAHPHGSGAGLQGWGYGAQAAYGSFGQSQAALALNQTNLTTSHSHPHLNALNTLSLSPHTHAPSVPHSAQSHGHPQSLSVLPHLHTAGGHQSQNQNQSQSLTSPHPRIPHSPLSPHSPHTHTPLSPHARAHPLTPPTALTPPNATGAGTSSGGLGASPTHAHGLSPVNSLVSGTGTAGGPHELAPNSHGLASNPHALFSNPHASLASSPHALAGRIHNAPASAFQFPRRVRKTSFDHTVSKEGIGAMGALGGRHQVNGRPVWVEGGRGSTLVSVLFCFSEYFYYFSLR